MTSLFRMRRMAIFAATVLLYPRVAGGQNSAPMPTLSSGAVSRVAGTVVNALSGSPLARARVLLADTNNRNTQQSMVTSEDGRFEFDKIASGKYSLQGAKRGFIAAAYDQHEQYSTAIVTGAGFDTEHLVLRIVPAGVLSGKVLDESGEPVRRASVMLYRQDQGAGVGRILRVGNDYTDDQGFYEFARLSPGTYFLSATAKPWYAVHPTSSPQADATTAPPVADRSLDFAYAQTYYGDATEPDDATPIPVRGGDRLQADIHMAPVTAVHVLVRIPELGGNGSSMPQLQQSTLDGMNSVPVDSNWISPGVYEITGIVPGRYNMRMQNFGPNPEARETIVDLNNDQELDTSSALPTATVKAAVKVPGSAKLPLHLAIALRNSKLRITYQQDVDEKGEVEFKDVAPDKYEVVAATDSKPYSVTRLLSQGSEISGHYLNVAAGSSLAVTLSVVGGFVDVEGVAKRAGKVVPGAMVVLVPKDPEAHHDLFRRDQSDLDGTFKLHLVIPGSYTVVAIANGWDLDWSRPAVINLYCKHGQTLTIGGQTEGSTKLPQAVEVQPR